MCVRWPVTGGRGSGARAERAAPPPRAPHRPPTRPPRPLRPPDWQTKAEREGKSPLKDPAAIIGLVAIFLPFVLLGIAFALGLVELPEQ